MRLALLLTLIISTTSCIPSTFTMVDNNFKLKGNSIAVIAGIDNESNKAFANSMTDALKKNSLFNVVSQKEVVRQVPGYPEKIKGPYKSAYMDINEDYSNTDINKIKDIQQKLKTDYIYVIWTPTSTKISMTGGSEVIQLHTITQLFEFPAGKEIAHAKFEISYASKGLSIGSPKDMADAMMQTSEYVSKTMAEKMGTKK